jgi:hypothetical protein
MPFARMPFAPIPDDGRMKLPRLRRSPAPADEREEWLATASKYARHLTETGSRCHLNDGTPRFCHWHAAELPATDAEGGQAIMVGVRCTSHPGGRYLDSEARLAPEDFA